MKFARAILVVFLAAVGLKASGSDPLVAFFKDEAPALEINVQVWPVERDPIQLMDRPRPGKYRCSAMVQAQPHRRPRIGLGSEDILISPGETKESVLRHGDLELTFRVEIGEEGRFAETAVMLRRKDKVIGRQLSTVWLARPKSGAVFLQ